MQEDTSHPPISEPTPPATMVRLRVSAVGKLNLADFQNSIPALTELAIVNETDDSITELTISLSTEPAFIKARTWSLDSVGSWETYHLSKLDVQLDGALLSRLTEAEPATLLFEVRSTKQPGVVLASHEQTVELLARNQWGGIGYLPEMVAAFVQPNDPAVDRLLKATSIALQSCEKSGSIDGYTHGAKRAWELTSGLWTAVLQRKLNYALPPASFEHTGFVAHIGQPSRWSAPVSWRDERPSQARASQVQDDQLEDLQRGPEGAWSADDLAGP